MGGDGGWRKLFRRNPPVEMPKPAALPVFKTPRIGLALGGGFARGLAHVGVLEVLEENQIPIDYIAGVSAGAIVAAAYASGSTPEEIARIGTALKFGDVARWTFCKLGLCCTDRIPKLLARLLKKTRFEHMRIPLALAATDLGTGHPVIFKDEGDMTLAIEASCAFPGIFQPVRWNGRVLTDGGISMEVPAQLARDLGADKVISICIPHDSGETEPSNLVDVVTRSLQILQMRTEDSWRQLSDLVIVPPVSSWPWHNFKNATPMIEAGRDAALKALPIIQSWLDPARAVSLPPAA
jgi:NTE family protein